MTLPYCNRSISAEYLQVPIALEPALHERVLSATAEFVDTEKLRDPEPPTVTKIDPIGIAHIAYKLEGKGRGLLLGCPTGHASILVHFTIRSLVPVPE